MRNQGKRTFWQLGAVFAVGLFTVACAADTGTIQQEDTQPQEAVNQSQEAVNQPQEAVNQPQELEDQPEEAESQPLDSPDFELGFERGSSQLKATDPESFVLAAGKPQLVELFAFW